MLDGLGLGEEPNDGLAEELGVKEGVVDGVILGVFEGLTDEEGEGEVVGVEDEDGLVEGVEDGEGLADGPAVFSSITT